MKKTSQFFTICAVMSCIFSSSIILAVKKHNNVSTNTVQKRTYPLHRTLTQEEQLCFRQIKDNVRFGFDPVKKVANIAQTWKYICTAMTIGTYCLNSDSYTPYLCAAATAAFEYLEYEAHQINTQFKVRRLSKFANIFPPEKIQLLLKQPDLDGLNKRLTQAIAKIQAQQTTQESRQI